MYLLTVHSIIENQVWKNPGWVGEEDATPALVCVENIVNNVCAINIVPTSTYMDFGFSSLILLESVNYVY